ncbi:MAG: ABC transporter ATP-binding protein [Wenzhouxiangellaceae bacterium]
MLEMKGVSKIYRTGQIETRALNAIDLHIREGEFVCLTGPSGSGKTTCLNVMGLLESFSEGDYLLDGQNVKALNDDQLSSIRNHKIGFIFQAFNLLSDLPAYDNIEVPLRYQGLKASERKSRIEHALETVGLSSRSKHLPAQLSGGQQQRIAIARALAANPRILLADEPTGNLDTSMAKEVMDLLVKINSEGTTIVMVTHDNELTRRASRNISILDGRILSDTPATKGAGASDGAPHHAVV